MFVLYVALITWLAGTSQTVTHFPLNAAVVVGQTLTFNCRTESHNSVWWKYKAVGSKIDSVLFSSKTLGEYHCDNCTVNNTELGQYDLQITNTRQSDAGTYICVEIKEISTNANLSRADSHAAELIVFASVPECGSNRTGSNTSLKNNDSEWMWCIIRYRGNVAPVMEWRNKANNETIPSLITSYQNRRVESEIIIQLKHDDNRGIAYSCTTYFNQSFFPVHGSIYSVANNTPDYTYTWTSQNASSDYTYLGTKKPLTETANPSPDTPNSETLAISMITPVVILLMILIFCIILSKLSRKGCFKKVSSAGPNIISHANTGGVSNIFYEDPHASVASPIDGERTNHAIRVYYEDAEQVLNLSSHDALENAQAPDRGALNIATARHDHVYSLEPVQTSFRQQHGLLQNEVTSVTTVARTHAMINAGGGGHGPYEEIEVDILRSINNPEERRAVPVNDGVYMQRPTFNDGTVYMQVNMGRGGRGGGGGGSHVSPRIQQTTPIQSLFSTSTYAAIDHTTPVLPLPTTTRRQ